jgi:hypothetical protein
LSARIAIAVAEDMRRERGTLDRLFGDARTRNRWLDRRVDAALRRELHDLTELAPTSVSLDARQPAVRLRRGVPHP